MSTVGFFFSRSFILHSRVLHDYIEYIDNMNARTKLLIVGISCTENDQFLGVRVYTGGNTLSR